MTAQPTVLVYGEQGSLGDASSEPEFWAADHSPMESWALLGLDSESQLFGKEEISGTDQLSAVGHSAYFSAVLPDGKVAIAFEHETNNPVQPTATDCKLAIFDPVTQTAQQITVPTSKGATSAVNPSNGVGGQDFSDLLPLADGRLWCQVSGAYFGWDINVKGEYPVVVILRPSHTGDTPLAGQVAFGWMIDRIITAEQLRVSGLANATLLASPTSAPMDQLYTHKSGLNGTYTDNHVSSECAQFPKSGHVIVGHYFPLESSTCGGFSVIDPATGVLKATFKIPAVGNLWIAPREIECNPTSPLGDERFTVILDTYPYPPNPHAIMEFAYNANDATIRQVSDYCTIVQDNRNGAVSEIGTHRYDANGNIFVSTNSLNSLLPGPPMAVIKKSGSGTKLATLAPYGAGHAYGHAITPDMLLAAPGANSQVPFSHDVDTVTNRVYTIGLNGYLSILAYDPALPITPLFIANSISYMATDPTPWMSQFGTVTLSRVGASVVTLPPNVPSYLTPWSLQMRSNFANPMAAQVNLNNLEPGRQYRARMLFQRPPASPNVGKAEIKIDCFRADGTHIGQQQGATIAANLATPGVWVTAETNFDVLDETAFIAVYAYVPTTQVGQTFFAANLVIDALPVKRVAAIDLGVNALRRLSALPVQIRKAALDKNRQFLWMPSGQLALPGTTGQNYVPGNFPGARLPQWLTKINLANLNKTTLAEVTTSLDTPQALGSWNQMRGQFPEPRGMRSPPVATWRSPSSRNSAWIDAFYVNMDYGITHWAIPPGEGPIVENLGGGILAGTRPAVANDGNGMIYMFAIGSDHQLWWRWWNQATGKWWNWQAIGGYCIGGGPAAACPDYGRCDVVVTGGYNVIYRIRMTGPPSAANPKGTWGPWSAIPSGLSTQLALASPGHRSTGLYNTPDVPGRVDLYAIANHQLYRNVWIDDPNNPGSTLVLGWVLIGGASILGQPSAVSWQMRQSLQDGKVQTLCYMPVLNAGRIELWKHTLEGNLNFSDQGGAGIVSLRPTWTREFLPNGGPVITLGSSPGVTSPGFSARGRIDMFTYDFASGFDVAGPGMSPRAISHYVEELNINY